MAMLTCGAANCTYNKDSLCCKGDIMVGGKQAQNSENTCCDSFREKKCGCNSLTSSTAHPSSTISIDCEAVKCVYNTDYRCKAEKVDIKGNTASKAEDTICATFKEK
ncbi:MAG: DUF1540 domain-containing protein [Eubacterium sp.]|nr:DUF1540 domain-containing protein [Eubacterium sp.]